MKKYVIPLLSLFILTPTLCFAATEKSAWDWILWPFGFYIAYAVAVIVLCAYKNEHGEYVRNWPRIKQLLWNKFTIPYISITLPLAIVGAILKKIFS